MEGYKEINGDLIKLAKEGAFDVITHGCHCFNSMAKGLGAQMADAFGVNKLPLEGDSGFGDIEKLGQIDYLKMDIATADPTEDQDPLWVVNSYTQYAGTWIRVGDGALDYIALRAALRKINMRWPGHTIGLPKIGCGLAGGDWEKVKKIIGEELKDMFVIIVKYKPE
jgi:O-acetyl-ADP-ribose deacetylase (regulator of RNase III)